MYRKEMDHPVYGEIVIEEEDFLSFHRTIAGLQRLTDVVERFEEKGVDPSNMQPGFIKVKDGGKEITYYKILDESSRKEMTLGMTQDQERFPLYPRDDAYWEPDGAGERPTGSSEREEPSGGRRAPARGEKPSGGDGAAGGAQGGRGAQEEDRDHRLRKDPKFSDERDKIDQIVNAREKWEGKALSDGHRKSIWRHCQIIRNDDPKAALQEALGVYGEEDLDITYDTAARVIRLLEQPEELELKATGEGNGLEPDDDLPF